MNESEWLDEIYKEVAKNRIVTEDGATYLSLKEWLKPLRRKFQQSEEKAARAAWARMEARVEESYYAAIGRQLLPVFRQMEADMKRG